MEKIVPIAVPFESSLTYINDVLEFAGARKKLSGRCFSSFSVYALAPEMISIARVLDFKRGGLLDAGAKKSEIRGGVHATPNTVDFVSFLLSQKLLALNCPEFWIHEPLFTRSEIVEQGLPLKVLGESLYLVFKNGFDVENLAGRIKYNLLSWHFLAFILESQGDCDSVDDLVDNARLMLIGAFDGESFLCVEKSLALPDSPASQNPAWHP